MKHMKNELNDISKSALLAGRIISGLTIVFLAFDGIVKVLQLQQAVEPTVKLGYAASQLPAIGILALLCLVLYVIPGTSVLGAVLLTGYLGGAIATHLRAGSDAFSLIFPVIIGLMMWGGLWLRNASLRRIMPLRA